ncbi:MAG: hypothetical protein ACI9P3_006171 [Bradyrhizobium sp.]|jgi:hypothetical protein
MAKGPPLNPSDGPLNLRGLPLPVNAGQRSATLFRSMHTLLAGVATNDRRGAAFLIRDAADEGEFARSRDRDLVKSLALRDWRAGSARSHAFARSLCFSSYNGPRQAAPELGGS